MDHQTRWPQLDWPEWRETAQTFHLWTQIVGKLKVACSPWLNHSWHVALYVSPRGLTTGPIFYRGRAFDLEFDMLRHALQLRVSSGVLAELALGPQSVAEFHRRVMAMLRDHGIESAINAMPNEIPGAVPFPHDDVHASYDARAIERFFQLLLSASEVMSVFRTGFLGKSSPVHFFWGSFDLAVTRFSGRAAPLHPGGIPNLSDRVVQEAYSHEVSSAGFWPGNDDFPEPAFYSYAYPEPPGFADWAAYPAGARYDETLREFILPLGVVRSAPQPAQAVAEFFTSSYEAAADLGRWDRSALECPIGRAAEPRPIRGETDYTPE